MSTAGQSASPSANDAAAAGRTSATNSAQVINGGAGGPRGIDSFMSPSLEKHLEQLAERHGPPDGRDTTVAGTSEGGGEETDEGQETAGEETEGQETDEGAEPEGGQEATGEEEGAAKPKRRKTSQTQRRINQLIQDRQHALDDRENALARERDAMSREEAAIRENATLRERLQRAEAGGGSAAPGDGRTGVGSSTAAPAPELPEWDPEKYKDQDDWLRDVAKIATAHATATAEQRATAIVEERLNQAQAQNDQRDQQQQNDRRDQAVEQQFQGRLAEARKKHSDFDEVVGSNTVPLSDHLRAAFRNVESGPELMYYLAQHPDECERLSQMRSMADVLVRFGELTVGLQGARKATASRGGRSQRRVAEPGTLLGGGGAATPETRDYSKMDLQTWKQLRASGKIR